MLLPELSCHGLDYRLTETSIHFEGAVHLGAICITVAIGK